MDTLHVVLALDRRCILGCAVSMRSLLGNLGGTRDVHFHLICNDVPEGAQRRLESSVLGTGQSVQVTFYSFDPEPVRQLNHSKLITHTAYALLFLEHYLPAEVHRCLAIDCDLVFERDAWELWRTDLQGCTAAAVDDREGGLGDTLAYQERLGLPEPRYFNSGVLLFDMVRWREREVGSRALTAARRAGDDLTLHDQDALNVALAGDWIPLDTAWNAWVILPNLDPETPTVLHFMGAPKPWHADCSRPFRDRFFHYLDLTSFAGWRPWNPLGIGSALSRARRSIPYLPSMIRIIRRQVRRRLTPEGRAPDR